MELTQFKTDAKKEIEGVWIDLGEGGQIKVARFNNPEYQKRMRQLMKPHALEIRRGTIDPEQLDDVITQCLAEKVLLGWKGIVLKGEPVEYSLEKAKEILMDPTLRAFRELVVAEADLMENFRDEAVERAVKNSESISDGS